MGWRNFCILRDVSSFNVEISILFHFPSSANEWNKKLKLIAPTSRENWFLWDNRSLKKEAAASQIPDCFQLAGRSAMKLLPFEMINQQKLHLMRRQKQTSPREGKMAECGKSEFREKTFPLLARPWKSRKLERASKKSKIIETSSAGFNAIYMFSLRPWPISRLSEDKLRQPRVMKKFVLWADASNAGCQTRRLNCRKCEQSCSNAFGIIYDLPTH